MLLERLEPGTMLAELVAEDDVGAAAVAAGLLHELWRPAPPGPEHSGLRPLASWCRAFDRNREALGRGDRGFPVEHFRRADAIRAELLASTVDPVVLHGDMHHFNVLRARRAPWLAIDPKGLVGDRHFDVCQFFRNPMRVSALANGLRLDTFCAELGLDRARTKEWCYVHAVLDAIWNYEDGNAWDGAIAYAVETTTF